MVYISEPVKGCAPCRVSNRIQMVFGTITKPQESTALALLAKYMTVQDTKSILNIGTYKKAP
jgi:hypothetical protein